MGNYLEYFGKSLISGHRLPRHCQLRTAQKTRRETLYRVKLKGQGQASKLLDGTGEFRPNIFKATLQGYALRIFGGLTDENTAERLFETLFGGVEGEERSKHLSI